MDYLSDLTKQSNAEYLSNNHKSSLRFWATLDDTIDKVATKANSIKQEFQNI